MATHTAASTRLLRLGVHPSTQHFASRQWSAHILVRTTIQQHSTRSYFNRIGLKTRKSPILGFLGSGRGLLGSQSFHRLFSSGIDERGGSSIKAVFYAIAGISSVVLLSWHVARSRRDGKTLQRLRENTLLSWNNVRQGRWWVLFTNAVTHINITHFVFNMFALNAFTEVLSMVPGIGGFHFLGLCIGSSFASSMAFLLYDSSRLQRASDSGIGSQRASSACGLSGLNMGLAASAACLLPRTPMSLMFIPIRFPLYGAAIGFVVLDLLFIGKNDAIGHSAHLGGFAYGILHYLVYFRRLRIPGSWLRPR